MANRDPKQWLPEAGKPDEECNLLELWSRYHSKIAAYLRFREPVDTCRTYTTTLYAVQDALASMTAVRMSVYDCWDAACSVLEIKTGSVKRSYSPSTIIQRLTIMADIFKYCEARGFFCNPLWCRPWEIIYGKKPNVTAKSSELRDKFTQQLERYAKHKINSLTAAQERKLIAEVDEHLQDDGRWIGIALFLYLGLRPSEGCAITFGDINQFKDYKSQYYVQVIKTVNKKGEKQDGMKNKYSYRILPIGSELQHFLKRYAKFVESKTGKPNISSLPIISKGENLSTHCNAVDMAVFTRKILEKLLTPEECINMAFEMITEKDTLCNDSDETDAEAGASLTTYLFRHNFATKMYALSTLTSDEIRRLMGHATSDSKQRSPYTETALHRLREKMEQRVINPNIHVGLQTTIVPEKVYTASGCKHEMVIHPANVAEGLDVEISALTRCRGDGLVLSVTDVAPAAVHIFGVPASLPAINGSNQDPPLKNFEG